MRVPFPTWAIVMGLTLCPEPVCADDVKVAGAPEGAALKKLIEGRKIAPMTIQNGAEKSTQYFAQAALNNEEAASVERENKKVAQSMAQKEKNLLDGRIVFTQLRRPMEFAPEAWPDQAFMVGLTPDGAPASQGAIYGAQPEGRDVLVTQLYRAENILPSPPSTVSNSLANRLGLLGILEPPDGLERNKRSLFIFVIRDFRPDADSLGQMRRMISDIRE